MFCAGPMIRMAQEKEKGIKGSLFLKGMSPVAFWLTWFISEAVTVLLCSCICVSVLYACELIVYTSAGWVWMGFWLFGTAYCCFGFLCSFFSDKAYTLAMFAGFFNLLTLAVYGVTQFHLINGEKVGAGVIYLTFLIAPVPFGHVLHEIIEREVFQRPWTPDMSPYGTAAYIFLVVDIFLYMALCLVIENSKDWFNQMKKRTDAPDAGIDPALGIVVRGLKKKFVVMDKDAMGFKKKKVVQAVNGLDLTVADKTIFCLLGHNGAGKTTTMSLITGALHPDEGWAVVAGFDVVKQRAQLRKSLGVCPQFDVLYSELTCWEHMHLYGGMQGLTPDQCVREAARLLGELDLLGKKDQKASNMSGGQQRRLSLAVALIGAPKVILLDEPTTGLDPANRRRVWKVLQEQKKTSTIIMTTHSMEEADLLADTIGVMSKGQIQAVGSALELKKQFGTGYLLHILKDPSFDEQAVLDSVHANVQNVQVSSNVSGEMALSLPLGQEGNFPVLFDLFDAQKAAWGIRTYSLSMSTLEEVFLRLAKHEEDATSDGNEGPGGEAVPTSLGTLVFSNANNLAAPVSRVDATAVEIADGRGGGLGGARPGPLGDVWEELETFECKKSGLRQVLAVISAGMWCGVYARGAFRCLNVQVYSACVVCVNVCVCVCVRTDRPHAGG
jgi:ABC-type multidrug transport system ATPase subunit